MQKFNRIFRKLQDPRAANAVHELLDVLVIALAAMLCGAKGATDMELFGRSKEKLLRQFLRLQHGIPSHDTFSRVFRTLEPEAFERMFRQFMAAFAKANGIDLTGVVAVDGKAVRGAYERGKSATPLHMVNVFAAEARMALASRKAPGRNEAQGALDVLRMLSLEGCTVTGDALHCNRPFATTVLARGGHYVLALKENQSKLFAAVERRFARAGKRSVRAIEPRSARIPPCHRHPRHRHRRCKPLSRRGRLGSHHLAQATSGPTRRQACRALLPALQVHRRQTSAARRAQSLEYREPTALGARRRLRRGSRPNQKRQRPREPRHHAALRLQPRPCPSRPHLHASKSQTCRMGRSLPARPPQPHAIALP
jgi:DDE_Tnp_1-associated/Transposase DDE domain